MNEALNFSLTNSDRLREFYEEMVNEKLLEAESLNKSISQDIMHAYKEINEELPHENTSNAVYFQKHKENVYKYKQKDLYNLARELNVPKRSTLKKPQLLAAVNKALDEKLKSLPKESDSKDGVNKFPGVPKFIKSCLKTVNSKFNEVDNRENPVYKSIQRDLNEISTILYHTNKLNKSVFEIPDFIENFKKDISKINGEISHKEEQLLKANTTYEEMRIKADISGLIASRNECELNITKLQVELNKSEELINSLISATDFRNELINLLEYLKNNCQSLGDELDINIDYFDESIKVVNDAFSLAIQKEEKINSILDKVGYSRVYNGIKNNGPIKDKTNDLTQEQPTEIHTIKNINSSLEKLKSLDNGLIYNSLDPKPTDVKEIKLTDEDGLVHNVIAYDVVKNTNYNKYIFDYVDLSNNKISSAMIYYNEQNEAYAVFINHNFVHNVSVYTELVDSQEKSVIISRLNDMKFYREDPNRNNNDNENNNGSLVPADEVIVEEQPDFSSLLVPTPDETVVKDNSESQAEEITEEESPFVNDSATLIYGGSNNGLTDAGGDVEPEPIEQQNNVAPTTSQFDPNNKKTLEEARKTKGYIQPSFRGSKIGEESGMVLPGDKYDEQKQQEFLEEMGYMKPLMNKEDIKISNKPEEQKSVVPSQPVLTHQTQNQPISQGRKVVESVEVSPIEFLKDKARALKAALTRRNRVSYGTMVNDGLANGRGQR